MPYRSALPLAFQGLTLPSLISPTLCGARPLLDVHPRYHHNCKGPHPILKVPATQPQTAKRAKLSIPFRKLTNTKTSGIVTARLEEDDIEEEISQIYDNNAAWSSTMVDKDPTFFSSLAAQQTPKFLWIGCSDSRVPANQLMGLLPGEVFVHRNIANVVLHADVNCLSVLQYAVEVLKVRHVIVCGHYGCGGVRAATTNQSLGLIDNWLRNIKDIYHSHRDELENLSEEERIDKLCEFNVAESVSKICQTSIVQEAWKRKQKLAVHGWIYSIKDGRLINLGICVRQSDQLHPIFRLQQ